MEKRFIGNSGLEVSAIGLGCMGMSEFYGAQRATTRSPWRRWSGRSNSASPSSIPLICMVLVITKRCSAGSLRASGTG